VIHPCRRYDRSGKAGGYGLVSWVDRLSRRGGWWSRLRRGARVGRVGWVGRRRRGRGECLVSHAFSLGCGCRYGGALAYLTQKSPLPLTTRPLLVMFWEGAGLVKLVVLQEWLRPTSVSILPIAKPYTYVISQPTGRNPYVACCIPEATWDYRNYDHGCMHNACFFSFMHCFFHVVREICMVSFSLFSLHFRFLIIYSEICILIIMCRLQVEWFSLFSFIFSVKWMSGALLATLYTVSLPWSVGFFLFPCKIDVTCHLRTLPLSVLRVSTTAIHGPCTDDSLLNPAVHVIFFSFLAESTSAAPFALWHSEPAIQSVRHVHGRALKVLAQSI
jgi:hypothetical protein